MRAGASLASLTAIAVLSGCTGIKAPDLFVVHRTGPGPKLTVLVNEEGGVSCNGGKTLTIGDHQLIQAREIQEDLEVPSEKGLSLPPGPRAVFTYSVRDEKGSVRFSDDSGGQPEVLRKLTLFVLQVAQGVCHLQM